MNDDFKKDVETLRGLFKIGVLKCPELLKRIEALERNGFSDTESAPAIGERILKYAEAAKVLGCSVPQIKKLCYAGKIERAIEPDGTRAYGVFMSSVRDFLATMRKR